MRVIIERALTVKRHRISWRRCRSLFVGVGKILVVVEQAQHALMGCGSDGDMGVGGDKPLAGVKRSVMKRRRKKSSSSEHRNVEEEEAECSTKGGC